MMARISRKVVATPSPGFAVDYNDLGNSYDASNELNPNRSSALLRRHGDAIHRFKTRAGTVGACYAM
jgi:hypothetical protein